MSAVAAHRARWIIPDRQPEVEARLQRELGIPALVAAILARRGMTDLDEANAFLNPSLDSLGSPSLLPDYEAACKAILGAKERGELIYIHGDYDVDGVTSAAILDRFLHKIGCKVMTHVPHRMKEGYGIHATAVDAAQAAGAKLFLTCDCGIAAFDQVLQARAAGMAVVVTDHHSIAGDLPEADAVVNPHREGSLYPYSELSGAGVVFRLCEGLTEQVGFPVAKYRDHFLDLAALGTIADVMPLTGENRVIARFGLQRLELTTKVGLKALMREAKVEGPLRSYHVGYVLGPRLNAAGRIDDAALALRLLLAQEEAVANDLAVQIENVNHNRRAEQQRIVDEAIERVIATNAHERNIIVISDPGWHAGIVGIVAGRLVEQFRRPVFVMTEDREKGVSKGSARTIPGFHLADAIHAHPDLFLSGGGHAMAAGCSFHSERLDEVLDTLDGYAGSFLTPADFELTREADVLVQPGEITKEAVEALCAMEPFGCANPEPLFAARGVDLVQLAPTKNPLHMRMTLRQGTGYGVPAMGFNMGERFSEILPGTRLDILFQPVIDSWQGRETLKWHLKDFSAD